MNQSVPFTFKLYSRKAIVLLTERKIHDISFSNPDQCMHKTQDNALKELCQITYQTTIETLEHYERTLASRGKHQSKHKAHGTLVCLLCRIVTLG